MVFNLHQSYFCIIKYECMDYSFKATASEMNPLIVILFALLALHWDALLRSRYTSPDINNVCENLRDISNDTTELKDPLLAYFPVAGELYEMAYDTDIVGNITTSISPKFFIDPFIYYSYYINLMYFPFGYIRDLLSTTVFFYWTFMPETIKTEAELKSLLSNPEVSTPGYFSSMVHYIIYPYVESSPTGVPWGTFIDRVSKVIIQLIRDIFPAIASIFRKLYDIILSEHKTTPSLGNSTTKISQLIYAFLYFKIVHILWSSAYLEGIR